MNSIIVIAGGTGGHIYVALAVADALRKRGVSVSWLGIKDGLEDDLAKKSGYEFDSISMRKVWGLGIARWLTLPFWLTLSVIQSVVIILRRRPDAIFGVGGFVCAPAGLAGWMLRRPLVIHESNTIAGLANRVLAPMSTRVLTGFPDTRIGGKPICVGNPVRKDILDAADSRQTAAPGDAAPLRLLVIGGSQGALSLNQNVPVAVAGLELGFRPEVIHQTGRGRGESVSKAYEEQGIEVEAVEFIDDMAEAYSWADVVISRAGALTIAELAAAGVPPILVPYPHAAKDHQRFNAQYLVRRDCAYMVDEQDSLPARLEQRLRDFAKDRSLIARMSQRLKGLASGNATDLIVGHCMEAMNS